MKRLILAAALAAAFTCGSTAPGAAASRTYDCSKPGNANKAVCKAAAKSAAAASAKTVPAKPAARTKAQKPPKAAETKVASTTVTKTVTQKNYDCSKAGNKNKAVCKAAAASPAKPVVKQASVATTTRHYDCTKAGNANKEQCKVSTSASQAVTKPVAVSKTAAAKPAARPAAAPRRTASATRASVEDHNPAGAIAQCKDGTYSHSKVRDGACSRHGGVAKWS